MLPTFRDVMKIVLSRKGFDSAVGQVPSPIFPDGRMLSLPIPHASGNVTYQDITFDGRSIGGIVSDLTADRLVASSAAHLSVQGHRRSRWKLPAWFHPGGRASVLSFHGNPSRWQRTETSVLLDTVGRGQEFVLDSDHYAEAEAWARELIAGAA